MAAIISTIVAMVLSMMSLAGFATWGRAGLTNVQTAAAASQMVVLNKAAAQYVQDNGSAIMLTATATTPVTVTVPMMISAGYLPTGFSTTNVFGQTWQLQVLQPTAGQLEAVVIASGGRAISNTLQLVQIAAQAGAQGGFVPYAGQNGDSTMSASNAYGAYGAWKLAPMTGLTNPGSGHLVSLLAFTSTQANSSYLYRVTVPGHPELNAMQTDLGLKGTDGTKHNITGASTVTADTFSNSAGGQFNTDQGGSLELGGNNTQAGTGTPYIDFHLSGQGVQDYNTRLINNANNQLALMSANGSAALSVQGSVTTPMLNLGTPSGNCSRGQMAMVNNVAYVCNQANAWLNVGNLIGNVQTVHRFLSQQDGSTVAKPTCTGGTATAAIVPQTMGTNLTTTPPWESNLYRLIDNGTYWTVQILMVTPSGTTYSGNNQSLTAEVDTQCTYANE